MFLLSIVFIVYATTMPWDITPPPHLDRVRWVPFWDAGRGRIAGIPDIVQNVLLFLPFGFFGWVAWTSARRWGVFASAFLMGCAGGMLSLGVEILQTMSPTRTPSTADLITNWTGAFVGALIGARWTMRWAPRWQPRLQRTIAEQPGLLVFAALFAAIAYGSLTPFLPTLDIGQLKRTVKGFLGEPWGPKNLASLLPDLLLYAALATVSAMEIPPWIERLTGRRSGTSPAFQAFRLTVLAAILLEGGQFIFRGHSPSIQDIAAAVVGAAWGSMLAHRWGCYPARKLGDLVRRRPQEAVAFGLLYPLLLALVPFQFVPLSEASDAVSPASFVPFRALFVNINAFTFFNVFSAAAAFLPLGYALANLGRTPARLAIACGCWGIACEVAQIPVPGRSLDTAVGIYAALMGLFAAWLLRRADRLARTPLPHPRRDSRRGRETGPNRTRR